MVLLPSHSGHSRASFSCLLLKAQRGPSCETHHTTWPFRPSSSLMRFHWSQGKSQTHSAPRLLIPRERLKLSSSLLPSHNLPSVPLTEMLSCFLFLPQSQLKKGPFESCSPDHGVFSLALLSFPTFMRLIMIPLPLISP